MRPRRGAHTLPQPDTPGDDPPALPPTAARVQGAEEEVPGRARPDRDGLTQRRNDLPASEGAARPAPASSRRLTFTLSGREASNASPRSVGARCWAAVC